MIDDSDDGSIMDDEDVHVYTINPEMAWAVRTSPSEVKIYLSEDETITLSQEALNALATKISPFRSKNPQISTPTSALTGKRFGRWTVLAPVSRRRIAGRRQTGSRWWCRCDCGQEKTVLGESLVLGTSVSCGCYKSEQQSKRFTKHGMAASAEYAMVTSARKRAEELGIPFDLEYSDIQIPENCPVFGTPLIRRGKNRNDAPSLDRLIPDKGYTKENVWVISLRANRLKNNMTIEEMGILLSAIKKKMGLLP